MANGRFSEQIVRQQQVQERPTRTERVQARQQYQREKYQFETYRAKAEELKNTEFANISFEEYETKYRQLSPELQQFFTSPSDVKARQEQIKVEERAKVDTRISQVEQRIKTEEADKQKYIEWYYGLSGSDQDKKRDSYSKRTLDYERRIEQFNDELNFLREGKGRIELGYKANDVIGYAQDLAQYQRDRREGKAKARQQFKEDVQAGKLDKELVALGLSNPAVTYEMYKAEAEKYNKQVAYQNQLLKWSENVGYEKLPQWTKEKINPSAQEWQKQNPTEVLKFDKSGNVTGVFSGVFGREYTLEGYEAKAKETQEYAKKLELEKAEQERKTKQAQEILKERKVGEGIEFDNVPDQNILQKAWGGIKSVYLSSIFGMGFGGLIESKQSEVTALREKRTRESFLPEIAINKNSFPLVYPPNFFKIGTIPLKTSQGAINYQRDVDYKTKQAEKIISQIGEASGSNPPELKPYIEAEGLKLLKEKGLRIEEKTEYDLTTKADMFGNIPQKTTFTINDPVFERRISQNMLELERSYRKQNKSYWGAETALLLTRASSSKAIETFGLFKGVDYGVRGAIKGYEILGGGKALTDVVRTGTFTGEGYATSTQAMKTVKLTEGVARVPRDYSLLKSTAGLTITGLYGIAKYQQYQSYSKTSEVGKVLFWAETIGELGAIEYTTHIGQKTYNVAKSNVKRWADWRVPTLKEADISETGFLRTNKLLGGKERVFMRRYEGFKLSKPKSWLQAIKGYKPGQFTERVGKITSDEVTAYYQYGGDVTVYPKGTKFKGGVASDSPIRTVRATPFPYDRPVTHYDWITRKNILEYGVGKYKKLPINVKEYKGYVYSATRQRWEYVDFKPEKLYEGGKEVAQLKGAVRFGSGKGVSEGFLGIRKGIEESATAREVSSPTVYANYLKNVKINKATGEIRGLTESGMKIKFPRYSADTGALGTGNIPMIKQEVEATYEFEKALKIRTAFYLKRGLWKVPVIEEVVGKEVDLKKLIETGVSDFPVTDVGYSSLPSRSPIVSPVYSIRSYPSESKSYSKLMSSISKISRVSALSKISNLSRVSTMSAISIPKSPRSYSQLSDPSSIVSDILSRISYRPYRDISRTPKSYRFPSMSSSLKGILKEKIKKKRMPEFIGILPDFTARALGLEAEEVSAKDAIKRMKQVKTGLEIRRGIRIKGFKNVQEKSLLKGIMA